MNKLDKILYKGQAHEIKLMVYAGRATQVIFRDNEFCIYLNNKLGAGEQIKAALQQLRVWMLEKAEGEIKARVKEFSNIIGVSYNNIRLKDTKTRWGSCSSKGNLNFNFRIIMAPKDVMDYIIVHELCHLKHMNHSKAFWDTVAQYMPDYEMYKEWLKKNGMNLYLL